MVASPLTVLIDPIKRVLVQQQPSKIPEEVFTVRDGLGFSVVEGKQYITLRQFDLLNPANPVKEYPMTDLPVVVAGTTQVFGGCAEGADVVIFHLVYFPPDSSGTPNFTFVVIFDIKKGSVTDAGPVPTLSLPGQPYTVMNPIVGTCSTDGAVGYSAASLRDPRNIAVTSFLAQVSGAREFLSSQIAIQALSLDPTASVLSLGLLAA